jgi:hypothetical protein
MGWINVAQDREQWWGALVKTPMNLQFYKLFGNSWVDERLAASEDGFISIEFYRFSLVHSTIDKLRIKRAPLNKLTHKHYCLFWGTDP